MLHCYRFESLEFVWVWVRCHRNSQGEMLKFEAPKLAFGLRIQTIVYLESDEVICARSVEFWHNEFRDILKGNCMNAIFHIVHSLCTYITSTTVWLRHCILFIYMHCKLRQFILFNPDTVGCDSSDALVCMASVFTSHRRLNINVRYSIYYV